MGVSLYLNISDDTYNDMNKLATLIYTFFNGIYLGSDKNGNKYYQSKKNNRTFGRKHRWVVYKGLSEPTKVSSEWYGWLHYQTDAIPLDTDKQYSWEKPALPNLTGTKYAYYPKGHVLSDAHRSKATGDYEAWRPN